MDIATVIAGLDAMIELEKKYGTTDAGKDMINGIISDVLDLFPFPFPIPFIGVEWSREELDTMVSKIQVRIRTYVAALAAPDYK